MIAKVLTLGVLAALVPPLRSAASAAACQEGLQRVDPEVHDARPGLRELLAGPFDPEEWAQRLRDEDLRRRERALDALLRRARLDAGTRAWLEELARAADGGELAWTARLAVRELQRMDVPQAFPRMLDPLGANERMGRLLQGLVPDAGLDARTGASGRNVSVRQDEGGAHVRVTETRAGEEVVRDYHGATLEELLAVNPELGRELGHPRIEEGTGGGLELRYDLGGGLAGVLGRDPWLQSLLEGRVELAPQAFSRPAITNKLGVLVRPLATERREALGLGALGLFVDHSFPETFAQLLGVRAGSVLLEIDAQALRTVADLERAMAERTPDDRLTLVWLDELGQRREKTWEPPER